jgi:uncharacterized protein YecT (DUF1311 family)
MSSWRFIAATTFSLVAGLLAMITASTGGVAAEINVLDVPTSPIKVVQIKGPIVEGDGDKFDQLTDGMERATIILASSGGLIREALQMGAAIRMSNYATMVVPDGRCYSACALIWVSGARRYMSASSQIGFHAAYRKENGQYKEVGLANAEIGSFLTHLGLRIEAIRFFTKAGPDDFLMLTPARARELGIEIFEQDGTAVLSPKDAPTVDTYADRFLAFGLLEGRCVRLLGLELSALENGARDAFDRGNELVGSEKWIDVWTLLIDKMKADLNSEGVTQVCLTAEAKLRSDGLPTGVTGPSYDCKRAATPTELAMCKDRDLWAKDRAIDAIYFWIREGVDAPTRQQVLAVQRAWLADRNSCGADTSCLHEVYDRRLADLKMIELPS